LNGLVPRASFGIGAAILLGFGLAGAEHSLIRAALVAKHAERAAGPERLEDSG
jgi:hypothetical protein